MALRLLTPVEANDEQHTTARSNVALYCVGFPFFAERAEAALLIVPSTRCAYASLRERDDRGCFGAAWGTR